MTTLTKTQPGQFGGKDFRADLRINDDLTVQQLDYLDTTDSKPCRTPAGLSWRGVGAVRADVPGAVETMVARLVEQGWAVLS